MKTIRQNRGCMGKKIIASGLARKIQRRAGDGKTKGCAGAISRGSRRCTLTAARY